MGEAAAGTPAHVFIARGDLFQIAADAIVVPTDAAGYIEPGWRGPLEAAFGWDLGSGRLPQHVKQDRPEVRPDDREVWFLPTGVIGPDSVFDPGDDAWSHAVGVLREVLLRFGHDVAEHLGRTGQEPVGGRARSLIAVPLLGSEAGGFRRQFRRYAAELLGILREAAELAGADVLLVIHGGAERAAAFEALCRYERRKLALVPTRDVLAERWERAPAARSDTTEAVNLGLLFDAARDGRLVPFFGAGVSMASGAAGWNELLDRVEGDPDRSDGEEGRHRALVRELDPFDRAQVAENRLTRPELLQRLEASLTEVPLSLQHVLLASLRPRDAITTNFDDAYERAAEAAGFGRVAVMPSANAELRLLKLHGSLHTPQMPPVLTRDQLIEHQLGLGPLRGALQMLLLTGHVVFIGYGLADPDLQAAIHEVRQIRRQVGTEEERTLATALQVTETPALGLLWSPTLQVLWPRGGRESDRRGPNDTGDQRPDIRSRELEILLDALADETALAEVPVLAFEDHELDASERELRERLEGLAAHFANKPVPQHVRELLVAYGQTRPVPAT